MALLNKPQQKTTSITAFTVDNYFFRSMAQDLAALSSGTEPKVLPQTLPKDSTAILSPLSQIKPETPQKTEKVSQPAQPILPPESSREQKFLPPTPATNPLLPITSIAQKQKSFKQIQQTPLENLPLTGQTQAKKLREIETDKQKQIRANNTKQAKQLYGLAKQLYKKKNYREAIVNLQESLTLKPDLNKSKRYLNKAQKKLTETENKQRADATRAQQQAQEIAMRQAEQSAKQQMAQEIEQARFNAQQEVQQQAQALQQKIAALKIEHRQLLDQQDAERLKLEKAQQEKLKTEALIKAQEKISQQKNQQIDAVQQQIKQRANQQSSALQQQLNQQERVLQHVQAQNVQFEKQRQEIQNTTQNYEQKLKQLQPPTPPVAVQPPINQPTPVPSPLAPLSSEQSVTSLPPPPIIPTIKPLQAPPLPQTQKSLPQITPIAKPQPSREQKFLFPTVKQTLPFKKLVIGIGATCLVLVLAGVVYWRFALKPTPPQPSPTPTTLKTPNIIIKLMRPGQEVAGWQKIVQLAVSSAIKLPLENYQIEPLKDINPWLGKELFYLNFDDTVDINQPSGAFVWTIDDKTSSQALFEKIKSRQRNQVSLQNYRQFDIVNCQNQYWAFADIFNLHYLILGQNLSSIKSVLDNLSEKNLDFIEYAEGQTAFWRNLPYATLYFWLDPTDSQISLWQIFRQLDLNVPVYVNQTLKNQAGIIFLDNLSPEIKDTRLAAIFSFTDFDATNQTMTNWEKTLSHDVNFLFWNLKPTLPTTLNFQGSIYNNAVIRYLTMPDKNLGIYYGLTKEQLILTNSEDGVKILIDNLQGI